MRILFVERNARLARLITEGLEEDGFLVDLRDSLGEASPASHGLIVVDADDESFAALRALRDRAGDIPLLILTSRQGFDGPSRSRHGLHTLMKPFRVRDLANRCRAMYRRPMPVPAVAEAEPRVVADLHA